MLSPMRAVMTWLFVKVGSCSQASPRPSPSTNSTPVSTNRSAEAPVVCAPEYPGAIPRAATEIAAISVARLATGPSYGLPVSTSSREANSENFGSLSRQSQAFGSQNDGLRIARGSAEQRVQELTPLGRNQPSRLSRGGLGIGLVAQDPCGPRSEERRGGTESRARGERY